MATGTDAGEGTESNTGPHPITAPFDWGLGSASAPVPAEPVSAVPPTADPATELIPAELIPAELPEPYFTSDSDDDVDPVARLDSSPGSSPDSQFDSPIDALFGETNFKDYEGEPLVGPIPTELNPFANAVPAASARFDSAVAADVAPGFASGLDPSSPFGQEAAAETPMVAAAPRGPRAPFSKNQKLLFWIAGGVIAVLILVVLFLVGTRIPGPTAAAKPTAAATKSAAPKVSASPTAAAAGPAAVGPHLWSDLRGGECLDPYTNPFELKYTVVDCAAPHPAQMVFRGTFPGDAAAAYPGVEALQSQINLLCSAPGVIDLATAGAYSDIQFQASFAATADEWTKGQHDYFCFVNRSGGEPITGSVAGTPAK